MFDEIKVTRRKGFTKRQRTPASSSTPSRTSTSSQACRRQGKGDTYHAVVWVAGLFLVTVFPVMFVLGTVVPLLSETVPYLASSFPLPFDLTPALQLIIVGFLASLTYQFHVLQLPLSRYTLRHEQEKWCSRCTKLVAADASHCRVCSQCIAGRKGHCFFLSVCWPDQHLGVPVTAAVNDCK